MKSEWKITSQRIGGIEMFAIYRMIDKNGIDHSGNREYAGDYIRDLRAASSMCEALNKMEVEQNQ